MSIRPETWIMSTLHYRDTALSSISLRDGATSPLEDVVFFVSLTSHAGCFPEGSILLVRLSPFLPPQSLQFPFLRANFISLLPAQRNAESPGEPSYPAASLSVTVNPNEPAGSRARVCPDCRRWDERAMERERDQSAMTAAAMLPCGELPLMPWSQIHMTSSLRQNLQAVAFNSL